MTVSRLLVLCGVALAAVACGGDSNGTTTPSEDIAYVRYVNAVPDTSGVDFRFVDALENSPVFPNVTYRQYTPYQATGVGARRIKVFINPTPYRADSSQIVARQFLKDTTVTFASKTYYTIVHAGYAKSGTTPQQGFYVIQDNLPATAAGKIHLRTINALFGFGSVDLFLTTETGSAPFATGTALESNVPVLPAAAAVTPYRTLDVRPNTPATSSYKLWVRKAGLATLTSADSVSALVPARISSDTVFANAVAGAQVDSTAFTALLLPRAGTCSKCATFTTPGMLIMVDRAGRKP